MKQIFTLLTIVFVTIFSTKTFSQNVNQSFETTSEVNSLISSCWTFNTFNYSSTTPISGTGSMVSQLGSLSEIITPELQIPTTLNVSFNYATLATGTGVAKLQIFIMIGATKTKIESFNLSGPAANGSYSASFTSANTPGNNINGSRKIVIEISNNASVQIDDLSINAPYTYSGGCNVPASIPLPIKLLSFQGGLNNTQAELKWAVAENETGDFFEVQRSTDGKNFNTVAIVSTTTKQGDDSYSYKEAAQTIAYYRLRIVNKDKSTAYSKILLLKTQTESGNTINLFQNPIQESLTFSFNSANTTSTNLTVYNLTGSKVYSEKINAQKGKNSVSVKLNSYLSAGTYILEVKNNTERSITKFIKQ